MQIKLLLTLLIVNLVKASEYKCVLDVWKEDKEGSDLEYIIRFYSSSMQIQNISITADTFISEAYDALYKNGIKKDENTIEMSKEEWVKDGSGETYGSGNNIVANINVKIGDFNFIMYVKKLNRLLI
jgi:hypothetical protein